MEKITDSFLKLLESFKTHPYSFIFLCMLLIAGYFMYSQNEYIAKLLPDPAAESEQFRMALERDAQINTTLEDALNVYGAQAVVIGQFHNGQYDLTNLPFTKVTVTYYEGATDLEPTEIYTTRPLSSMNRIMRDMWKGSGAPVCVKREVSKLKDLPYRQRMEKSGLSFVISCPVTNIRDYPIGYLSSGYTFVPTPEEQEILVDYQYALSGRVAGYLQTGVVREKN